MLHNNLSNSKDWNSEMVRATRKVFLLAGMLAAGGAALAQGRLPDDQVEANVLKALASAPELASESITTRTAYGTVTLSGSVSGEAARTRAENLAANAAGVQKVVDELRLGSSADSSQTVAQNVAPMQQPTQSATQPAMNQPMQQPSASQIGGDQAAPLVLQSDGTYAPAMPDAGQQSAGIQQPGQNPAPGTAPAASAQRNNPEADQALDQQMEAQQNGQPNQNAQPGQNGQPQPNQPYSGQPYSGQNYPAQPGAVANGQQPYPAQPYPPQSYPRRPMYAPYPGYPPAPYGYPQQGAPAQGGYAQGQQQPVQGGQAAGLPVTIPGGALLRVRINRTLSSDHTPAGTTFDGVVVNDVVANGLVAIPRGATVQGTVVDAKSSGVLKGRGEMSIQLTQVTLGGRSYPLASDVWAHNGGDKTIETVNKTAGFGAVGAVIGALAGGGAGAAIGGGVGAAAGLGSSAASGNGQVYIPAEAIVTFHTTAETQVATVSEQEMQRLAYGVPNVGQPPQPRRVYRVYPGYYPPPGYYPYPAPYGYPNY